MHAQCDAESNYAHLNCKSKTKITLACWLAADVMHDTKSRRTHAHVRVRYMCMWECGVCDYILCMFIHFTNTHTRHAHTARARQPTGTHTRRVVVMCSAQFSAPRENAPLCCVFCDPRTVDYGRRPMRERCDLRCVVCTARVRCPLLFIWVRIDTHCTLCFVFVSVCVCVCTRES